MVEYYGDNEEDYEFSSVEQLLADFQSDIERLRYTNE